MTADPNGWWLRRWRFRRLRRRMEYGAFISQMRGFSVETWLTIRNENDNWWGAA